MASLNKVQLIGRLGQDPEVTHTASGMAICKFSIATTETYGKSPTTEWHSVVTFDKLASICGQYLKKGRMVYVEGRIQTGRWTGNDGVERKKTEIIANAMQILSEKQESQQQCAQNLNEKPITPPFMQEEDIPF